MIQIHNVRIKSIFLLFLISNSILAQKIIDLKPIFEYKLQLDVTWLSIHKNSTSNYIFGKTKHSGLLYNFLSGKLEIFPDMTDNQFTFISDSNIYFITNNSTSLITVFSLNGNKKNNIILPSSKYIIEYKMVNGEIFYSEIDLSGYQAGYTGNMLHGQITNLVSKESLIKFSYLQNPPPARISLPIFLVKDKIYLANQDEFKIEVFSKNGNKLKILSNPYFKPTPYSKEEYILLPIMRQSTVKIGITHPPVIEDIDITSENMLIVTRFVRPGASELIIDTFDEEEIYKKTFRICIEENKKIIAHGLLKGSNYGCLFIDDINKKVQLKVYELFTRETEF